MRLLLPVVVSGAGLTAVLVATLAMTPIPQERVTVTCPRNGQVAWVVEDGAVVQEGDVLVRLDPEVLERDLQGARVKVAQAEAVHQEARARGSMSQLQQRQSLAAAEMAVELARMDLARVESGLKLEERRLARRVEVAKATVSLHMEQLVLAEERVKSGRADPRELQDVRLVLMQAEADLELVEGQRQLHQEFEAPMELRRAEFDVEQATGDLELARLRREQDHRQGVAEVAAAEAAVALAREQLARIEQQLVAGEIHAPCGGTVDRMVQVGVRVREGQPLLHLATR